MWPSSEEGSDPNVSGGRILGERKEGCRREEGRADGLPSAAGGGRLLDEVAGGGAKRGGGRGMSRERSKRGREARLALSG